MTPYPITFEPQYFAKVWGGRGLEGLGRTLPAGKIGESWEISDRTGAESVVANGPLAGLTLRQVIMRHGAELMGPRIASACGGRFPLLVKLIDAAEDLSVQVHPDDAYARAHGGPQENGKTEMWVVLRADPGAGLVAGFAPGTSRAVLEKAIQDGTVEGLLRRASVRTGDAVFVPAGRVHAVGKGCLIAEIQQNSDTTYRVFDYNRLENGKPRPLHVAQALDALDFSPAMEAMPALQELRREAVAGGWRARAARCPHFEAEELGVETAMDLAASPLDSFQVLMGLAGLGAVEGGGVTVPLRPGATVLVPHGLDTRLARSEGGFTVLRAWIPR